MKRRLSVENRMLIEQLLRLILGMKRLKTKKLVKVILKNAIKQKDSHMFVTDATLKLIVAKRNIIIITLKLKKIIIIY